MTNFSDASGEVLSEKEHVTLKTCVICPLELVP